MKIALQCALLTLLVCGPIIGAVDVLLLGDDYAETQVQGALEAAGHAVTYAGLYFEWDGVTPAVSDFDVVVFLDGYEYGHELQPMAATALQSFVAQGHGLVMTEWVAWDVCEFNKVLAVRNLMPVTMPDCNDYDAGETWTVLDPNHPLAAGVPPTWTDERYWSGVTPKAGSVVVIAGATGNPMLTYSQASGGTVVHVNHDMYDGPQGTINANVLQLIVNAAEYGTFAIFSDGFESGDTSAW